MNEINWSDLFNALALMLVFEGILPFLSPEKMRKMMQVMYEMDDNGVRTSGLTSMIVGAVLLYLINH